MEELQTKTSINLSDLPFNIPGQFIGGKWLKALASSEEKTSESPSNGQALARYLTSKEAGLVAIEAAQKFRENSTRKSIEERIEQLDKLADYIEINRKYFAQSMQLEAGKPAWEAYADVQVSIDFLRRVMGLGSEIEQTLLSHARLGNIEGTYRIHPLGVCVAYLPFSSPLTSFVNYFCAAILAGCPLVVFSSGHGVLCALKFTMLEDTLGLMPGNLSIIFGGFDEFRHCLSDHRVESIIYTGSKEHCDTLSKDVNWVRDRKLVLQSGSKNSALVHSTADLNEATNAIMVGAFKSAGQLCTSTNRVFVYRSLLDEFKRTITEKVSNLRIGATDDLNDGVGDGPMMGPLYCAKAADKFLRFQTMASRESQETWCFGRTIESFGGKGHFVSPGVHLLPSFNRQSAYQRNIILGPDLAVYPYDVLNDAIAMINDTESCNAVSFFGDESILRERCHLFSAPNIVLNGPSVELDGTFPLAGRSLNSRHLYQGLGLALYLSYPQCILNKNQWQSAFNLKFS